MAEGKTRKTGGMDTAEKLFCYFMARLNCPEEAAVKAGYPPAEAEKKAAGLLEDSRVRRLIKQWRGRASEDAALIAALGLERIIFSPIGGVLALIGSGGEIPDAQLDNLDMFAVSEIKKQKGGGIEIKLFDKVKAAALLADIARDLSESNGADKKNGSFLEALEKSAVTAKTDSVECDDGEV